MPGFIVFGLNRFISIFKGFIILDPTVSLMSRLRIKVVLWPRSVWLYHVYTTVGVLDVWGFLWSLIQQVVFILSSVWRMASLTYLKIKYITTNALDILHFRYYTTIAAQEMWFQPIPMFSSDSASPQLCQVSKFLVPIRQETKELEWEPKSN